MPDTRSKQFPIEAPDMGYVTGSPFQAIPDRAWSACLNMRFRLGNAQKVPGFVKVQAAALDSAVMGLYNYVTTTGASFWIAATLHKVWKMSPTDATFVDISGGNDLAGVSGSGDWVTFATFKDQLILTNGHSVPWQATVNSLGAISNISALAGSPPSARRVLVWQNHVVLADLNPYASPPSHQTFQWSDLGNSGIWSSGEAGSLALVDEPDGIMDIVLLRDSMIVYKKTAVYIADYTGFPFTVSTSRLISGAGPIAPNAVVNVRDAHYFASTDRNFYQLTLFGPRLIGQQVRSGFWSEINATYNINIMGYLNEQDNEVIWMLPTGNNQFPDKAYIYEYLEDKWGRRDFGGKLITAASRKNVALLNSLRWQDVTTAWNSQTATWGGTLTAAGAPIMLIGDSSGFVYQFTTGQVDVDGAAMNVQSDTKYFTFGDELRRKRLQRLGLQYTAQAGTTLTVQVLTFDNLGASPTVAGTFTKILDGTGQAWIDCDITGRYFAFRFINNVLGQTFNLTGFTPTVYVREVV